MQSKVDNVGCVKAATAILGDKWTPQLLRFFINETTVRFCELQELVGNINPRTLSARLHSLEKQGVIIKQSTASEHRCDYQLTAKGKALLPILRDMEVWSSKYQS